MSEGPETTFPLSPLLREALAVQGAREDFEEALLRALKARGLTEPTMVLSAVNRVLELEVERTKQTRAQVISRLAQQERGPQLTVRRGGTSTTIRAGGKEYHSLEELPPELREAMGRALPAGAKGKGGSRITGKHTGCMLPAVTVVLGGLAIWLGLNLLGH